MQQIIAVVNQKGGVGKTTTSINLGVGLSQTGKKVLLVDADAQCNLSIGLDIPLSEKNNLMRYLEAVINMDQPPKKAGGVILYSQDANGDIQEDFISKSDMVLHSEEGVDVITSDKDLFQFDKQIEELPEKELLMKRLLEVFSEYDYIVIDCMPVLGNITVNTLTCADIVIIPTELDRYGIEGLQDLEYTINNVRLNLNPNLRYGGILLTKVDFRANFRKSVSSMLEKSYSNTIGIYKTTIPFSAKASEAQGYGQSIFGYKPSCKVAKAYRDLTNEVLGQS